MFEKYVVCEKTLGCVSERGVQTCVSMCMSVCEKDSECGPSRKEMQRDELVYPFVYGCENWTIKTASEN